MAHITKNLRVQTQVNDESIGKRHENLIVRSCCPKTSSCCALSRHAFLFETREWYIKRATSFTHHWRNHITYVVPNVWLESSVSSSLDEILGQSNTYQSTPEGGTEYVI